MKKIFILTGKGGSGKDTLVDLVSNIYHGVVSHSMAIIPKNILKYLGIKEDKTNECRKLLSDLKIALDNYNNYNLEYCFTCIDEFVNSLSTILFIQSREIKDIEAIQRYVNGEYKDIQFKIVRVVRDNTINKVYGNIADDSCNDYDVDITIYNNSTIEDFEKEVEYKLFNKRSNII